MRSLKETDMLNHLLGQYMSYAFNDAGKYPKKPFLNDMEEEVQVKPKAGDDNLTKYKFLAWAETRNKTK